MTKRKLEEESLVAIMWHNEEGTDTGFLVCHRSRLDDTDLDNLKKLHKQTDIQICDAALKYLKKNSVLSTTMLYPSSYKEKKKKYESFKFRPVKSLLEPEYPVTMFVTAYDTC